MRALALILILMPAPALALERVTERAAFLQIVSGKTITFALFGVRLQVLADGRITGEAQGDRVTGQWQWREGYFCREMRWGDEEIAANCQRVDAAPRRIRFTSDRGAGRSATFGLR